MGIYDRDYYREREEKDGKPYLKWIVIIAVLVILALIIAKGF